MENTLLLIGYACLVALVCSVIGFFRTVWFISIGYTVSIVAMCVCLAVFYFEFFEVFNWLQVILLAVWGTRLGSFLIRRELNKNYTAAVKDQTESSQGQSILTKVGIWVGVCILYAMMFSPAVFALQEPVWFGEGLNWTAWLGVGVMLAGLGLESMADRQKSKFKKKNPRKYCDVGLYRWVRCPNYFGEVLVWTGNLVVALSFMQAWWQWTLAITGWACLVFIMMSSTKRLESKQMERYGADPEFQNYSKSVPILFPWLPVYSFQGMKWIII